MVTKFKNKKVQLDDYLFDSQMEARYYKHLNQLKQDGIVDSFELQPIFLLQESFRKNGKVFRAITYKADFFVVYTDGHIEVVDIKGRKEPVFNLKYKLFERRYKEYSLKLLTDALKHYEFITLDEHLKEKRKRKRR